MERLGRGLLCHDHYAQRGDARHDSDSGYLLLHYIFLVISGVSALLPYLADRLVAPRFKGVLNTLVFPCTLVAAQFVYSHGPVGSWGSIPYT
jgi:hypothetical protein